MIFFKKLIYKFDVFIIIIIIIIIIIHSCSKTHVYVKSLIHVYLTFQKWKTSYFDSIQYCMPGLLGEPRGKTVYGRTEPPSFDLWQGDFLRLYKLWRVIFLLLFVYVSGRLSACLQNSDFDAVFAKRLLTLLSQTLLKLVTLGQRSSKSQWLNIHFFFIILC